MKNESNTYNINNPDGSQGKSYDYKKLRFDNDSRNFIKENPIADQGELFQVAESFDDPKQPSQKKEKKQEDQQQNFDESSSSSSTSSSSASSSASSASSSASSAASSASSAASSAASSVASSISSGIGALAGTVASAAVAAAIVVVAVVNAFLLNVSLLMSTESSFVFQVEMTGSEEDFVEPIYAILSGPDGTEQERELEQGITNITFENLTSGVEYTLRVRNSEKLLFERSYVTPSETQEKGFVEIRSDNKYAHVLVGNVYLENGEFYTLVVKDAKSKVVLSKDGTESSGNYKIEITEKTDLFATLSVGGKVYAVAQISVEPEKELDPNYDFNNGVWKWSERLDAAQVSFARKDGGDPMVLKATVKKEVVAPTCEEDGYTTITATATYEGRDFTDQKVETDEDSALGHAYGEPVFEWLESGDGYIAKVTVTCENDPTHQIVEEAELTFEETPADCENDRCVSYYAIFNFNDEEYTDEKVVTFEDSALGHAYGEPVFEWIESDDGYVVTATFTCLNDETHQTVENAVVTFEETPADCENDAVIVYTATIELDETTYSEEKVVTIEYSALGHNYADPDFWWSVDGDGYTARASFVCLRDETHQVIKDAEITLEETPANCEEDGYITYIATVVMGEETYSDDKIVTLENSATGHSYGEPVFEWIQSGNGYTAKVICVCENNEDHTIEVDAEIGTEEVPADCENDGAIIYYAYAFINDTECSDEKVVTFSETALGHNYSELVEEEPATCDTEGFAAHYYCLECEKLFDANENEVSEEDLIIPAIGIISGDPTKLKSGELSYDLAGRTVFLMVDDGSAGVALGQTNNTSTDSSMFTKFKIEEVWNDTVILSSPDGRYIVVQEGSLQFTNDIFTDISVYDDGSLSIGSSQYRIVYKDGMIQALSTTVIDSPYVCMYLLPAPGHDYGDLVPENYDGNGLMAHYECSICHKLFNENKIETTAEDLMIGGNSQTGSDSPSVEINLSNGPLYINPFGYARSESDLSNPTPFVSSATNPYLIMNQTISGCDNIIQVYQTDSSIAKADIYIKLSNVRIEASSWCSLFLIKATKTLNITLIIEGDVTFAGGSGQQIFSSQGSGSPTVNIIIDQTTFGGRFNAEISDGLTHAETGTINVRYE